MNFRRRRVQAFEKICKILSTDQEGCGVIEQLIMHAEIYDTIAR